MLPNWLIEFFSKISTPYELAGLAIAANAAITIGFIWFYWTVMSDRVRDKLRNKDKEIDAKDKVIAEKDETITNLTKQLKWAQESADKIIVEKTVLQEKCNYALETVYLFNNRLISVVEAQCALRCRGIHQANGDDDI